jgi:hypothetical protein
MRGGHGDTYYYQLVRYIRKFKGARSVPAHSTSQTIRLTGGMNQWDTVTPEYFDHNTDTFHRDHPGWGSAGPYINSSGRNNILSCKVTHDADNLYFMVETEKPITPSSDPQWMMLFLDVDGDPKNGWEGFNHVVGRTPAEEKTLSLDFSESGWDWWRSIGRVEYAVSKKQMHLSIPRKLLGITPEKGPLNIHFAWADNAFVNSEKGNISDWIDQGDTAPGGRFCYWYKE